MEKEILDCWQKVRSTRFGRSLISGLCGSIAHSLLMFIKSTANLLPSFQPYEALQTLLGRLIGVDVHPLIPWILSFINGSIFVGFAFGRLYPLIPGRNGAVKGMLFGVFGWLLMGLVFFPMLGMGLFAGHLGLGIQPALFSLAMLLSYSVVMGVVYASLAP